MKDYIVAASILSADFARLGQEVDSVVNAGADWIHFDVMDNHYVPNLTFSPAVCKSLRKYGITAPIDVHLMVEPVDSLIPLFAAAGASHITFNPEATRHVHRTIQTIRDHNMSVGIALNPATPISCLDHILAEIDLIQVMSVNPGFGGQSFIPSSLDKCSVISRVIRESGHNIRLAIDGGVNSENIDGIAACGVDTFIAGSAIFGNKSGTNYQKVIADFRRCIRQLHQ